MRRALALVLLLGGCACGSAHELVDAHGEVDGGVPDALLVDARNAEAGLDAPASIDAPFITPPPRCAADHTRALVTTFGSTCRLDSDGQLWCWGANAWGQVRPGGGSWVEPVPVAYDGLSDVVDVAASGTTICVAHRDGGVSCWGRNAAGEVGDGTVFDHTSPFRVPGVSDVDHVVVGNGASCGHQRTGHWMCWGTTSGILGDGTTGPHVAMDVPSFFGAHEVAVGWPVAAVFEDGHVVTERRGSLYTLAGVSDAIDVAAIDLHTCLVRRDGTVWCWEPDPDDRFEQHAVPVIGVTEIESLVAMGGTFYELCGIRRDHSLMCWTLASGNPPMPTQVVGGSDVDEAALGSHICVASCDGEVRCNSVGISGENGDGQSGIPPRDVAGVTDALSLSGECVLRPDRTLSCWDAWGAVRAPSGGCVAHPAPETVAGIGDVDLLLDDSCASLDDGSIACWSASFMTWPLRSVSVVYVGLAERVVDFAIVSAPVIGGPTPFALTGSGHLFYWATSGLGGSGPTVPIAMPTPELVDDIGEYAFLARSGHVYDIGCTAPFSLSCAIGGTWPGVSDATAMWLGGSFDCVRRVSGEVWCRFRDSSLGALPAALGIATPSPMTFVPVPVLDGAQQVVGGGNMLCARDAMGAVDCFGANVGGCLGSNDPRVTHTRPIDAGATDLTYAGHSCALRSGVPVCWGASQIAWSSGAWCALPLDHVASLP